MTVSEWADAKRRLSSESSAEPGTWRTDRAPYQRGLMDAISDPRIREIWFMKSAQVGWTEILNNVIGFFIDLDAAPILLVQPTLEMAEAWSKDRFAPMLRDTPCLRDRIADPKARDSGNTLLHKKFTGGHLTVAGANSPAGLASRPIRIVLFDEVDRFPASAGTEGDPVSLGKKRAATFWNRKMLAGSTPTVKGQSRIEAGFENSDQRFYFVPCPHCEEFQRLTWAQVQWPEGRPTEAAYFCKACGARIDETQKYEMLRQGEWRSARPFNGIAGFHISELYSPWSTWPDMAVSFLEAKRLPETLQTWINTSLGETWEEKGNTPEAEGLLARRESYTANSLPLGVVLLTMGTDVQDDRIESTIWGWGAEEQSWRIEHIVLRGNPGAAALWAEHDEILRRRFPTDDGRTLVIEACCVDSGGHFTEHVYAYCARRKRYRVWAIKGAAGAGRLIWPKKASRGGTRRVDLWIVGVDTVKDLVYGRLSAVTSPGPGYTHFDADTTQEWLDQLTSEVVTYRNVMGRKVKAYKPKASGVRQEALDTTVYAHAAMVGRGGAALLARRAGKLAQAAPEEPPDSTPTAAEPITNEPSQEDSSTATAAPTPAPVKRRVQRPTRPGGWIKSWRR
jgi:phage terminase large subunit GpA-like protein